MKVIFGITGSIAAYKALELIRLLKKNGHEVRVILTKAALEFVTPLSCQTLSENEVYIEQFVLTKGIKHLTLSDWGDILVVAPATANIIAKSACGIADDLLSTTILSFPKKILFVPAMDSGMWVNRAVVKNIETLKNNGYFVMEPSVGHLASGKVGKGRFPQIERIYKKLLAIFSDYPSLSKLKFLITGGRTEEDIDSVRVLTNRSTGLMGKELYEAVIARDGEAKLIMGQISVPLFDDTDVKMVRTSKEMFNALKEQIAWCNYLIMAAAIGDYKPKEKFCEKLHSPLLKIQLNKNFDLLSALKRYKGKRIFIGFSVEDKEVLKRAKVKLVKKGLDYIIHNPVSAIGSEKVSAILIKKDGAVIEFNSVTKWELANQILNECVK